MFKKKTYKPYTLVGPTVKRPAAQNPLLDIHLYMQANSQ